MSVANHWIPEFKKVGFINVKKFTDAKKHQYALICVAQKGGVLITTLGMLDDHKELMSLTSLFTIR
ncbi:hypothetical protein ACP70R_029471 [Stipagrostis hirtigluma subsp. patula]